MRAFSRCLHTTPEFKIGTNPIELLQKLHRRGLVKDNSAGFSDHLLRKRTVYAGFDPTAETLHIGSLSLLATMCMFAKHGHEVIALIGGATALVGDPSGRSTGRKQLSIQQVEDNSKGIAEVIQRVVGRYSSSVRIVNNADWMSKISLLDFLRSTGNHFRVDSAFASVFAWKQFRDLQVGALLSRDSVKNRMTSGDGLSFTEMSYQLMQAHDFAFLHKEFGCTVQLGGADQWGNIVGGIELVRKVHNAEVHALTIPLILNSSGEKLGKSAGNAVWLRQDMTSLYSFRSVV
jgi:tyrosyl-tRNA synthetase